MGRGWLRENTGMHLPLVITKHVFVFQLCVSLTCRVVSDTPYTVAFVDGSAGGLDSTHLWACLEAYRGGEKRVEGLLEKVRVFTAFSVYELLTLVHSIHHHVTHQVWLC